MIFAASMISCCFFKYLSRVRMYAPFASGRSPLNPAVATEATCASGRIAAAGRRQPGSTSVHFDIFRSCRDGQYFAIDRTDFEVMSRRLPAFTWDSSGRHGTRSQMDTSVIHLQHRMLSLVRLEHFCKHSNPLS